jgi:hypothetical protein
VKGISSLPTKQPRRLTGGGRETEERRRQLGRARDFQSFHQATNEPRGIHEGGGETEDRKRQLGSARDFQSSHQATTRDHWGRWRDDRS